MSSPRDPSDDLTHLSPEMVERYERALRHPHAGVVKFMENAYATAASGDNAGLPEADRIRVYLSVYNTIQELTKGSADAAQADTDRLWGRLSAQAKRDMAANPGAAAGIVSDAMRSDAVLAAKLPDGAAALTPPVATVHFDGLGRDPFDRRIAGNRVAGVYSGNSTANYSSLNGSTYDPVRGVGTLTAQNFATSPFVGAGFSAGDISFIKQLHSEGYSTANIVNAGKDARVLGFSAKDHKMVKDLATVDRYDPDARGFVRKTLDLKHSLEGNEKYKRLAAELAGAKTPAEIKAASDAIARHETEAIEATGVGAHIRSVRNEKAREAEERITVEVVKANRRAALKAAHDAKINPELVERMRQGDPEAKTEFAQVTVAISAGTDRQAKKGVLQLEEILDDDARLKEKALAKNAAAADQNAAVSDRNIAKNEVVAATEVKVAAADASVDDLMAGINTPAAPDGSTDPNQIDAQAKSDGAGNKAKSGTAQPDPGNGKQGQPKLRLAGIPTPGI